MKTLIFTSTFTLACVTSISIALITSTTSRAYAADRSCLSSSSSATTGGAARQQLVAIAQCDSNPPPLNNVPTVLALPKSATPKIMVDGINTPRSDESDVYPAYCAAFVGRLTPDDFGFYEALQRCTRGN
jgi:hypothetical protein